jgi:hypothetical protein
MLVTIADNAAEQVLGLHRGTGISGDHRLSGGRNTLRRTGGDRADTGSKDGRRKQELLPDTETMAALLLMIASTRCFKFDPAPATRAGGRPSENWQVFRMLSAYTCGSLPRPNSRG